MEALKTIGSILLMVVEVIFAIIEGFFHGMAGLLAILRVKMHRQYDYRNWLKRDLEDCQTILELGCGANSPLLQTGISKRTTTVDIWKPYVEMHNQRKDYYSCSQADILSLPMGRKMFDAVVMCDVLEHLPLQDEMGKPDGKFDELLERMEGAARKKVIIFTPNGFIENDEVDGDPFQKHLSAWEPHDYTRRGYEVKGATGLRYILGKASRPKYHPYSIFEIVAMISQPFIFKKPEIAWHSYAVKELK